MHRHLRIAALGMALLGATATARADEISEGLERARQLYEKGELGGAVTEANFALNALFQKRAAVYAALFPPAPAGWTLEAEDDRNASGGAVAAQILGGGVLVDRTYTRDGGEGSIEASVFIDNPMIQAFSSMVNNPAILGTGARRIRIGNDNAVLQREPESDSAELTLVRGNLAIKLSGNGLPDTDILVELMKRFDIGRLQNPPAR
jgi:hypothetical protein